MRLQPKRTRRSAERWIEAAILVGILVICVFGLIQLITDPPDSENCEVGLTDGPRVGAAIVCGEDRLGER